MELAKRHAEGERRGAAGDRGCLVEIHVDGFERTPQRNPKAALPRSGHHVARPSLPKAVLRFPPASARAGIIASRGLAFVRYERERAERPRDDRTVCIPLEALFQALDQLCGDVSDRCERNVLARRPTVIRRDPQSVLAGQCRVPGIQNGIDVRALLIGHRQDEVRSSERQRGIHQLKSPPLGKRGQRVLPQRIYVPVTRRYVGHAPAVRVRLHPQGAESEPDRDRARRPFRRPPVHVAEPILDPQVR